MSANPRKQLRRLPQVFTQTLELPLRSHANVSIEERSDCFRFTANIEDSSFSGKVTAHVVKIRPEVTKVVIRGRNGPIGKVGLWLDKLEVNVWRFRLPETTQPELATAIVVGRNLTVTVPKGGRSRSGGKVGGGGGRLITIE